MRFFCAFGLAPVLAGCAGGDAIVGPSDNSRGMIVGGFDYSESEYIVTAITLDPLIASASGWVDAGSGFTSATMERFSPMT